MIAYEQETNKAQEDVSKLKANGTADEADIRQAVSFRKISYAATFNVSSGLSHCQLCVYQERVQAEAAKMIPDSKARLIKSAEELRELMVSGDLCVKPSRLYIENARPHSVKNCLPLLDQILTALLRMAIEMYHTRSTNACFHQCLIGRK